mmetsp:Transcript_8238/g.15982  ORF Transcript_8238/g.15982 Transcript_8238/m.15982 type:complete len:293 (-) Transcript_8238:1370-2248(-)
MRAPTKTKQVVKRSHAASQTDTNGWAGSQQSEIREYQRCCSGCQRRDQASHPTLAIIHLRRQLSYTRHRLHHRHHRQRPYLRRHHHTHASFVTPCHPRTRCWGGDYARCGGSGGLSRASDGVGGGGAFAWAAAAAAAASAASTEQPAIVRERRAGSIPTRIAPDGPPNATDANDIADANRPSPDRARSGATAKRATHGSRPRKRKKRGYPCKTGGYPWERGCGYGDPGSYDSPGELEGSWSSPLSQGGPGEERAQHSQSHQPPRSRRRCRRPQRRHLHETHGNAQQQQQRPS